MHLREFCNGASLPKPVTKTNLDTYKFKKSKPIFLIMKLTALLLITATHVSATGFPHITIFEKNAPLEKVFKEIEKQSGYVFFYDLALLNQAKAVSIKAENAQLAQVLKHCFQGQELIYSIVGKTVVVKQKEEVISDNQLLVENAINVDIKVSGTITDITTGKPLAGATVKVKGSNIAALTDENGNFTIDVPATGNILEISYVGYETIEAKISKAGLLNITLKPKESIANEVVVVGYGTQKKINLTGSVGTVKSEELGAASNLASASNALVGRLAGLVSLQSSGQPGYDGAGLSIRGFGNALIIVDGVETNFNAIDVNQIESVSILKDGSASIYGSRAGNGVILVTMKRGYNSKPVISLSSAYTAQSVTNQPTGVNSWEFAELSREAHLNAGLPQSTAPFTLEQIEKYRLQNDPNYPNTNWYDYLVRARAPQWQNSLGVRGGSEKIKYYGYIGVLNQETMFKFNGGGYKRYNFQSNIDAKILDNLSLRIDVAGTIEAKLQSASGYGQGGDNPTGGAFTAIWQSQPIYPATLPDPSKTPSNRVGGGGQGHIMTNVKQIGYADDKTQNFRGTAVLDYQFTMIQGLSAKAFFNANQFYNINRYFLRPRNLYFYDYTSNIYTSTGGGGKASLQVNNNQASIITQQYSLNYGHKFGGNHNLNVLALYETIEQKDNTTTAKRSGFLTPAIEQLFGGDPASMEAYGSASEMGRKSYVFRLNYSFKDKYLLESSVRADASAKFSKDFRWGYFPSVSLGWVISKENFMAKVSSLDLLKLRASYGKSGNDGVGNFQYLSGYQLSAFPFGGSYGFSPGNILPTLVTTGLANPKLTWEEITIYNGGIDYSLWGRKLYGSIDVFYRTRKGIPATRLSSLPSTFGSDLPPENLNSLNDRGFELEVGTQGHIGEMSYNLRGTLSNTVSYWDHFEEPVFTDADQEKIFKKSGRRTDVRYGYLSDGLFASQTDIDNLPFDQDTRGNVSLRPGDIRYKDLNKDGKLDWKDQVEIGKGNVPHWITGLNVNLRYKKIDLSVLFQGAFGFYTYIALANQTYTDQYYKNRWTAENNNGNALYPRNGGSSLNNAYSDFWYRDAKYMRLKSLNIGYTVSTKLLAKAKVHDCRIYFAGQNLFTASGLNEYSIDPEAPNSAAMYYYPQQRTLTLGLNISL
jgi:TonB-linked SusC/RagA family outer membrane protein